MSEVIDAIELLEAYKDRQARESFRDCTVTTRSCPEPQCQVMVDCKDKQTYIKALEWEITQLTNTVEQLKEHQ